MLYYVIAWRAEIMEDDLKICCAQMIKLFQKLLEQGKITKEKYDLHTKEKIEFIKYSESI